MSGAPTVRCIRPGVDRVLHEHAGGDYGLADIPELFQLGRLLADAEGRERVLLTAPEIRELRVMADAYSSCRTSDRTRSGHRACRIRRRRAFAAARGWLATLHGFAGSAELLEPQVMVLAGPFLTDVTGGHALERSFRADDREVDVTEGDGDPEDG